MNRLKLYYLFFFVLAAILYSCTGSGDTTTISESKIPVKDIKEKVNKNSNLIKSLEASGSISIDSPELSNSGSVEIRLKKPDSLYVKIEGPFGVSIATALITRNNFIYYNAQENNVITGPTNEINIGAILKIRVTFDELMSAISGSISLSNDSTDETNAMMENENYVIQENDGVFKKKFLIDQTSYALNSYLLFDNKNNKLLEVNYSKYNLESEKKENIYFPGKIKIYKPDKEQTVWVDYDSKQINKDNITFKIKVPKSAKEIKWN